MRDRQPLFPGRVRMLPVAGQENVFDMVMADEPTEEGTAPIKKNLLTDLTASLYGLPDPTVNDLLGVLSGAAMIKEVGGEPIRTPVALSSVPVGTTIMVSVNGTDMPFIVAQLNYPSSGNTLLVASVAFAAAGRPAWAIDIGAVYNGSTLDGICNTTFINALSDTTRNAVQTVSIASFGATLQRKGFSLSATELGNYGSYTPSYTEGNLLTLSATLRPVFSAASWTRSQYSSAPLWNAIKYEGNAASYVGKTSDNQCYVRPAFCLPQTFTAYKEGNTYYTDQAYANTTLAAATVLGNIIGGFTRIETGEYTGNGNYSAVSPITIPVAFKPKFATIIGGTEIYVIAFLVKPYGLVTTGGTASLLPLTVNWDDEVGLSFYSTNSSSQINRSGLNYTVIMGG